MAIYNPRKRALPNCIDSTSTILTFISHEVVSLCPWSARHDQWQSCTTANDTVLVELVQIPANTKYQLSKKKWNASDNSVPHTLMEDMLN